MTWTIVNSLWPSDTIWWHKSGSTLAQVMACCLTAPSHYLNQCWLIISKVQWHRFKSNFTRDTPAISPWNWLEKLLSKFFVQISQGPMSWLTISSMAFCGIPLRPFSQEVLKISIRKMSLSGRISITCAMLMWKNDMKYQYMFLFPLKNLAC